MVLSAAVLLAGCSSGEAGAGASPGASVTASATASVSSGPPTPSPSTPPPYPTGSAGCHRNTSWSTKDAAEWLRLNAKTPGSAFSVVTDAVELERSSDGYGPLCRPLTVHVEIWKLGYSAPGPVSREDLLKKHRSRPDYYFEMTLVKRERFRVDGREAHSVRFPRSVRAANLGACAGSLVAVSVGGPLAARELPRDISTTTGNGPLDREDVGFRTRRVAEYGLRAASAPQVCGPDGRPTATPSPGGVVPSFPGGPSVPAPPS
ncbi:hypothetical protein ACFYYR_26945 [Streptomyces sp. NPDC001922]|uniref:hypothetical protein n=1 Tax=Streptomyces sp. NPDC001922 TaxID=3364624 RepID=UPI0036D1BEEB